MGGVKELIEPKQEKLTPEFYLGSKANPDDSWVVRAMGYDAYRPYDYIGDGELSIVPSEHFYFGFAEGDDTPYIWAKHLDIQGTATVTSAETDNYKAGKWTFYYSISEDW